MGILDAIAKKLINKKTDNAKNASQNLEKQFTNYNNYSLEKPDISGDIEEISIITGSASADCTVEIADKMVNLDTCAMEITCHYVFTDAKPWDVDSDSYETIPTLTVADEDENGNSCIAGKISNIKRYPIINNQYIKYKEIYDIKSGDNGRNYHCISYKIAFSNADIEDKTCSVITLMIPEGTPKELADYAIKATKLFVSSLKINEIETFDE